MPQRLEKSAISPFSFTATTAIVCPRSSSIRAARPDRTSTEKALTLSFTHQLLPVAVHGSPWALPAAHTRMTFSVTAGLGHGRNRLAEVVPELLLAVVVDDAVEAEAQVEEVHGPPAVPPPEDVVEQGRIVGISVAQRRQRHRDIVAAARAERDREHGDVRTRSDTGQGGGDTRDRGAMREPVARLVGRSGQELLGDRLALEERVALVDPGVDDADGYSLARSGVGALVAGDVGMGPIHVDRAQAPLVVELNPRGGRPGQRRGPPASSPATAERRQRTEKRRPACNLRPAHEHVPLARPETGCRRPASG